MAHFYGTLQGNRGEASRLGTKDSGINTIAAGWGGAIRTIRTSVYHSDGRDMYRVELIPWHGSGGSSRVLAQGELCSTAEGPQTLSLAEIRNGTGFERDARFVQVEPRK